MCEVQNKVLAYHQISVGIHASEILNSSPTSPRLGSVCANKAVKYTGGCRSCWKKKTKEHPMHRAIKSTKALAWRCRS